MDYWLKQISPCVGDPLTIPINSNTIEIGRSSIPELAQYTQVSRRHAKISKVKHEWVIEDLNSMNGVFIEHKQIGPGRQKLNVGDTIGFGVPNLDASGFVCIFMATFKKVKDEPIEVVTISDEENDLKNDASSSNVMIRVENSNDNVIEHGSTSCILSSFVLIPSSNVNTTENNSISNSSFMPPSPMIESNMKNKSTIFANVPSLNIPSSSDNVVKNNNSTLNNLFSSKLSPSSSNKNSILTNIEISNLLSSSSKLSSPNEVISTNISDVSEKDNLSPDPKSVKDCAVHLIKCDSNEFAWPNDVKKTIKSLKRVHSSSTDEGTIKKHKNGSYEKSEVLQNNDSSTVIKPLFNVTANEMDASREGSVSNDLSHNVPFTTVVNHLQGRCEGNDRSCEDDDNGFGYSQIEEVINISDDESYLDFNTSQPIKLEPSDEEEEYFEILDELPSENDILLEYDSGANTESIESICNFMKSPNISPVNVKVEQNETSDSNFSETALNNEPPGDNVIEENQHNNLNNIQDFSTNYTSKKFIYKEKKSDSTRSIDQFLEKKKLTKPSGKTMLTEPKPMERRPRRIRSRDEWFQPSGEENALEKTKHVVNTHKDNKKIDTLSSTGKNIRKDFSLHSPSSRGVNTNMFSGKSPNKQNFAKDRIYLEKKEKLKQIEMKKMQQAASSASPIFKKPAPVKKRNDNFGSRSQFLTTLPSDIGIKSVISKEQKSKSPESISSRDICSTSNFVNKDNVLSKDAASSYTNPHITRSSSISKDAVSSYTNPHITRSSSISKDAVPSYTNSHVTRSSSISSVTINKSSANRPADLNTKVLDKGMSSTATVSFKEPEKSSSMNKNPTSNDPRLNKNLLDPRHKIKNQCTDNVGIFPKWGQNKNINKPTAMVPDSLSNSKLRDRKGLIPAASGSTTSARSHSILKINFYSILEKIVGLNIKWILEQKKQSLPPPDVSKGAVDLPLHFESYEHYISVFQPMLMLEIWDEICREAAPILENHKVLNKFYFVVNSYKTENGFLTYECESLINKNSPKPLEGTLVILEIKTKDAKLHPILGYINNYYVANSFKPEERPEFRDVDKYWTEGAKLWKFSILTKIRCLTPILKIIMKGNVVFSIKNKLRLADALNSFQNSPLHQYILKPDKKVCFVDYPTKTHFREFSLKQTVAIEGISRELSKPRQESKIILLQGPPGTGKTHTIVGLLESLVYNNQGSKRKFLVLSPSNAAIDEIGSRLIDLNEKNSYKKIQINFVRIGLDRSMNSKMRPYSLDEKADNLYDVEYQRAKNYRKLELQKKEKELEKLKVELEKYPSYKTKQTINSLQLQCNKIKEEIESSINDRGKKQIKMNILKDCHIILSTLGSCCQSVMISAFQSHVISFSACIIDEATQCTEIDILQPLTFNINKLVLVGDHNQLPATVSSQVALKNNFDRSMFERFHLYFSTEKHNPIFMLTEQFRMHSEICSFPSRFFYAGKLRTSPDNILRYDQFPVKPYFVYDILDSQESNSLTSKTNHNEARAIAGICAELINLESTATIGIITPYQAQVKLYKDALHQNPYYKNIEINTVDSFQGREKDIIIVSCVRANSSSGGIGFLSCRKRLNVAITRARHCLIICVHAHTLEIYNYWKNLINDARERKLFATVPTCKDISDIFNNTLRKRQ